MSEVGLNVGLMWFSYKPWLDAVQEAADFYQSKYGKPEMCVVHPSCFEALEMRLGDIQIIKSKSILKKNYWIGSTNVKYEFISDKTDEKEQI